ncbi:CMRF35-like molecule 8 isoform X2 [Alosa sapidissima]|uniref:CMRF35-like molecule 8 isoform X2 n=1 Tax=Alosa sapidissima TaxID=34773 RepID=UPI001C08CE5C|nr:CMRF35-like molecule 8 isoform X2 [Alosa sapidissima]
MGSGLCLKIFLLCSAWIVTDGTSTTEVTGSEGGSVHITWEYNKRYSNNTKYFCKGTPPFCEDMVRTDATHKLVIQGRYTLEDNGSDSFQVDIAQLSIEDEGIYQCAVDIPFKIDQYEEVYIDVTDEATISPTLLPNVTLQHEGTAFPKLQPTIHPTANSTTDGLEKVFPGTSGPNYTANSTTDGLEKVFPGTSGPKGEPNEHTPKLVVVLSAIVGLTVVLMVAMLILSIILCVKRAKSSDSINLPAAMETASVGP